MINLRYHIVSIVAVFLALGIGVLMGSTVVDRATVDFLRNRIDVLERQRDDARQRGNDLDADLGRVLDLEERFRVEGRDQIVQGRLANVPVLVVGVRGIPEEPVDQLEEALAAAGAVTQGTVWLTDRLTLDDDGERDALAQALGLQTPAAADAGELRGLVVGALAGALTGTPPPEVPPEAGGAVLPALRQGGFLDYDAPPETSPYNGGVDALPLPETRIVVVSGTGAEVADDVLAAPLASALAGPRPGTVVVSQVADAESEETPPPVVGLLRDDEDVRAALSTVDNLQSFYGQFAAVLALADLAQGRPVGHYGVGDGAQGLLPAPPPA